MARGSYTILASAPVVLLQGKTVTGKCPRCGVSRQVRKVKGLKLGVVSLCRDCKLVLTREERKLWA